jgi:hypothetical protein
MKPRTFAAAAAVACAFGAFAATAEAQTCSNTSVGLTPLNDLGSGTYAGFTGGLYPGGSNAPPSTHAGAGLAQAALIAPRLPNGTLAPPALGGRVVLCSLGMSNATQEFSTFLSLSNGDVLRNPATTVVDAAQGGVSAALMADPLHSYWTFVSNRLAQAGVSENQVQAVWIKNAHAGPTLPFPAHALSLKNDLRAIVQNAKAKFPNLKLAYLSSRSYGGYAATTLNPEPYAYESGFSVKWLIEDQIAGDPALNFDPLLGPVTAPWISWGPYLWADGLTPRSDGLFYECRDFAPDGVHPATLARFKIAERLHAFFTTEPTATPWYATSVPHPVKAALFQYGEGSPGVNGPLLLAATGGPVLGAVFNGMGVVNGAPNAPGAVYLSSGYDDVPVSGAHVHVSLAGLFAPTPTFLSTFTTNAQGFGGFVAAIPNDPSLMGVALYGQVVVLDPAAPAFPEFGGVALTRGVRMTLGIP